jgi:hypothetical protein
MADVDGCVVEFKPLLARVTAPVNRVRPPRFQQPVNALIPGIRQVPRFDEFQFHTSHAPSEPILPIYICNAAKRMSIQEISFAHAVAIVSW